MKELCKVLRDEYGVSYLEASPTTIAWAVATFAAIYGKQDALVQLHLLNDVRERHGKRPCYSTEVAFKETTNENTAATR